MTVTSMESRKRPSLLIVLLIATVFFIFGGFLYSFHRNSKLLIDKHATLTFNFKACQIRYENCDHGLKGCVDISKKYNDTQSASNQALKIKDAEVAGIQKTLKTKEAKFSEVLNLLKQKKAELADVNAALKETSKKLSTVKQTNFNLLAALSITVPSTDSQLEVTSELEDSAKKEIERLKNSDMWYMDLKRKLPDNRAKNSTKTI